MREKKETHEMERCTVALDHKQWYMKQNEDV